MTYAQGRTFRDADSHIMELPDFLIAHADPDMRERMPEIHVDAPRLQHGLRDAAVRRAHPDAYVAELLALGDGLIAGPKGYQALGAFNANERSRALYPYEDVGELIEQSDSRLYMFSSDYPHVEGGRNPLGRFEASLAGCDAASRERFYSANFAQLFAARSVHGS